MWPGLVFWVCLFFGVFFFFFNPTLEVVTLHSFSFSAFPARSLGFTNLGAILRM